MHQTVHPQYSGTIVCHRPLAIASQLMRTAQAAHTAQLEAYRRERQSHRIAARLLANPTARVCPLPPVPRPLSPPPFGARYPMFRSAEPSYRWQGFLVVSEPSDKASSRAVQTLI